MGTHMHAFQISTAFWQGGRTSLPCRLAVGLLEYPDDMVSCITQINDSEGIQAKVAFFYDQAWEVTHCLFYNFLFSVEGDYTRCEYQEVRIIRGHLRGWLLLFLLFSP